MVKNGEDRGKNKEKTRAILTQTEPPFCRELISSCIVITE